MAQIIHRTLETSIGDPSPFAEIHKSNECFDQTSEQQAAANNSSMPDTGERAKKV